MGANDVAVVIRRNGKKGTGEQNRGPLKVYLERGQFAGNSISIQLAVKALPDDLELQDNEAVEAFIQKEADGHEHFFLDNFTLGRLLPIEYLQQFVYEACSALGYAPEASVLAPHPCQVVEKVHRAVVCVAARRAQQHYEEKADAAVEDENWYLEGPGANASRWLKTYLQQDNVSIAPELVPVLRILFQKLRDAPYLMPNDY